MGREFAEVTSNRLLVALFAILWLFCAACAHDLRATRISPDEILIDSYQAYTVIMLPNGVMLVDTKSNTGSLLESLASGFADLVVRGADSITYQLGETATTETIIHTD